MLAVFWVSGCLSFPLFLRLTCCQPVQLPSNSLRFFTLLVTTQQLRLLLFDSRWGGVFLCRVGGASYTLSLSDRVLLNCIPVHTCNRSHFDLRPCSAGWQSVSFPPFLSFSFSLSLLVPLLGRPLNLYDLSVQFLLVWFRYVQKAYLTLLLIWLPSLSPLLWWWCCWC